MPILAAETDLHPLDLFECDSLLSDPEQRWWVLYTRSRQEKKLMRHLRKIDIPHYGPMIEKRSRTPGGRRQTSFVPLFPNYVFMMGCGAQRYAALATNCVSRDIPVNNSADLLCDLRQLRRLIQTGMPLTHEPSLEAGARIRVCSGPLTGQEGTVLCRRGDTRLLVAVRFLQQGASVQLDECELERIE